MPQRIPPQLDLQILTMLSEGYTNKKIAQELNVSPSYVSKVKNGKKTSYIPIVGPTVNREDIFTNYTDMSDEDLIKYLDTQIECAYAQIKLYETIKRRIKLNAKS